MTIIEETTRDGTKKYDWLLYVEFLDMVCRIAIVAISMQDLIEYKVNLLLEIVYDRQYSLKEFNETDNPLIPVDEFFRHDKFGKDGEKL